MKVKVKHYNLCGFKSFEVELKPENKKDRKMLAKIHIRQCNQERITLSSCYRGYGSIKQPRGLKYTFVLP